jgi:hypothetical protein
MKRRIMRWVKRIAIGVAVFCLLLILFAHRWFAVTRPGGSSTLVVEGWLYAGGCDTIAAWYRRGAYDQFLTTGTMRPFTYSLHHGDTLVVRFEEPVSGQATLRIDGLPEAWALITTGTDSIAREPASDAVHFTLRTCLELRIIASSANPPPDDQAVIFAGHLTIGGINAHATADAISIRRRSGIEDEGWPSFAHEARHCLIAAGIPRERIAPVPATTGPGGRTWSNALAVAAFAQENGIDRFDVATMGVHARRTWRTYRKALKQDDGIGIRSIHDPWCARGRWWLNPFGWILVLKEVVAIPAPSLLHDEEEPMKR